MGQPSDNVPVLDSGKLGGWLRYGAILPSIAGIANDMACMQDGQTVMCTNNFQRFLGMRADLLEFLKRPGAVVIGRKSMLSPEGLKQIHLIAETEVHSKNYLIAGSPCSCCAVGTCLQRED